MSKKSFEAIDNIDIQDNCLAIAGKKFQELMQDKNLATYIYDKNKIAERISHLKNTLPQGIEVHYALKANPMQQLADFLSNEVDGFDVASLKELNIALDSGIDVSKISFAGPGKSLEEIELGVQSEILFNVESKTELERIIVEGKKQNKKPRVAFRVNPEFELKMSGMKMGGGPKQFGIDSEQIPQILQELNYQEVSFEGFHIFSGSQNLKTEAIIDCQNKTIELALELAKYSQDDVKLINIGGGFGIPYFPGETSFDLEMVSENLKPLLGEVKEKLPNTNIAIELGRYIVGEAGYYICQVTDIKESRGEKFLVTNGGMHHHLAASGNFGQVIRKNYPIILANKIKSEELEPVNIVGPCCTPLDIIGSKVELPQVSIGDYIAVLQSGAYGATASPLNFLGHKEVVELLV